MSANSDLGHVLNQVVQYLASLGLPLDDRPAHPAIKNPDSGDTVPASQTGPTPLNVDISSNRPALSHTIQLLDGDTFAVVSTVNATFVSNLGNGTVQIPTLTGTDPKVFILQCTSSDPAGNVCRILIRAQAPVVPPPPPAPTLTGTLGTAAPFPPGNYPKSTAGLNAVTFVAQTPGAGITYVWIVQVGMTPVPVPTTSNTIGPIDLTTGGMTPYSVSVTVLAKDAGGVMSTPTTQTFTIT